MTAATKTLVEYSNRAKQMPNGGARLTISPDGTVGDGYSVIATYHNRTAALDGLRAAGFVEVSPNQWKPRATN